jgi:diguanylate cyclase (GGDEF)-like protein
MHTERLIDQLADLASQRNHEALDQCFMDLFNDLLSPQRVAIYRWVGEAATPFWRVVHRLDRNSHLMGTPLLNSVVPHNELTQAHLESWQGGMIRQQLTTQALTLVPMGCQDETHCLVEISSAMAPSLAEERLVRGVQRFYAHLRALLDENERDALTRLLNRKSFDETFLRMALHIEEMDGYEAVPSTEDGERRLAVVVRPRCWLGVIDIDHFKKVNDTHGHLIGDEVLILVAQVMRKCFRTGDRIYRFGGEEFVVLLRAVEPADACAAFERFRHTIESFEFPQVGQLTVSVGFSEVLNSDTPSTAFERADNAVYHAKKNGRNQLANHDALVSSGDIAAKMQATEVEFF